MYHTAPAGKKSTETGHVETYKLKETFFMNLSVETIANPRDTVFLSKEDRVLYVLKGLGYAKLASGTFQLTDGCVLEVPAGQEVAINGQLQYMIIESRG